MDTYYSNSNRLPSPSRERHRHVVHDFFPRSNLYTRSQILWLPRWLPRLRYNLSDLDRGEERFLPAATHPSQSLHLLNLLHTICHPTRPVFIRLEFTEELFNTRF
eukprot:scaffold22433_cov175-Skeletonema_marinoi.AAC.1